MNKYSIRRQILQAVIECEPAPALVADIASFPPLDMNPAADTASIASEAAALAERGYLQNLRPTREPLYRITASGRGQLSLDDERAEFIWGEFAL